jgi:RNA polymerase sigma-70 factor (ECF subfamily)
MEDGMSCDERDFQRIHETYRPRLQRYLTRVVNEYEAEDLTQEVLVKVSQALPAFRGESQLSTWIYRIATNAAIDRMRTVSFRQDVQSSPLDDTDGMEDQEVWIGEGIPSPDHRLLRKERFECFESFVQHLPPSYRTVVVLAELEEFSNREIAEILGLSLDTVKIRLHRGRTRLLQELKAYCKAEDWL